MTIFKSSLFLVLSAMTLVSAKPIHSTCARDSSNTVISPHTTIAPETDIIPITNIQPIVNVLPTDYYECPEFGYGGRGDDGYESYRSYGDRDDDYESGYGRGYHTFIGYGGDYRTVGDDGRLGEYDYYHRFGWEH